MQAVINLFFNDTSLLLNSFEFTNVINGIMTFSRNIGVEFL